MSDIISATQYGEILVTLNTLLNQKGISSRPLARALQCEISKLDAFRNNEAYVLHPDLLARLCYVLCCDLSDLIVFIKSEKQFLPPPSSS